MHSRYIDSRIKQIWNDENKLMLWQETELAVLKTRADMGEITQEEYRSIEGVLNITPIDMGFWRERDAVLNHDLNAFLEERSRHLPLALRKYFHKDMTSYDTEEAAFTQMLQRSATFVIDEVVSLMEILRQKAMEYRYVLKMGRTHCQQADLQTFGQVLLTWYQDQFICFDILKFAKSYLRASKLSGAIGNYTGLSPEMERRALEILKLTPWYGATQIMPRHRFSVLAISLVSTVMSLDKLATEFRLGSRNPYPLWQEPFGKKQKGSSAMPQKKNPIGTEKVEGMGRMAKGYLLMLVDNIRTWEQRAIEQSCVERVAWPDLFHVTIHTLNTIRKVVSGMRVYPENMLRDIAESRGCYAASEAKERLADILTPHGLEREDAYRIVQLAAFNAFEPAPNIRKYHDQRPGSLAEARDSLEGFGGLESPVPPSLLSIITNGHLEVSDQLEPNRKQVVLWNAILFEVFKDKNIDQSFKEVFSPEYLLRHEATLYKEILGV